MGQSSYLMKLSLKRVSESVSFFFSPFLPYLASLEALELLEALLLPLVDLLLEGGDLDDFGELEGLAVEGIALVVEQVLVDVHAVDHLVGGGQQHGVLHELG
jgi:hypothetical protein